MQIKHFRKEKKLHIVMLKFDSILHKKNLVKENYNVIFFSVLPTHGPVIDALNPPYFINQVLNISCTSGASKPTAHMKWYINDLEVRFLLKFTFCSYNMQSFSSSPIRSCMIFTYKNKIFNGYLRTA